MLHNLSCSKYNREQVLVSDATYDGVWVGGLRQEITAKFL